MADPRQLTILVGQFKRDISDGAGSATDNQVIVDFDRDANQLDVIAALEKIKEKIIEDEY